MPTRDANPSTFETPACKACGGPARERLRIPADRHPAAPQPSGPLVPYFECASCGLLFSTHLDAPAARAPYDESYFETVDAGTQARADVPLLLALQAARWLGRSGRVLDFGCGTGLAVARMREAGLEAYGSEVMEPQHAREFVTVGRLEAASAYDVITAVEVVEHLGEPHAALGAIARALRPGGVFSFTTMLHEPARLAEDWWYLAPGAGHISLHTRESLARLAQATGFAVLLSTPTNHLWVKGPLPGWRLAWLRMRVLLGRLRDRLTRSGASLGIVTR